MARFLFLQDLAFEYLGPMHLSAVLKAKGHECDLLIIEKKKDLCSEIKEIAPDAILISSMTGPHVVYIDLLKKVRQKIKVPVMMGGPHPTFFPQVLENPEIDYICVGEGEGAIVDFADAIEGKRSFKDIPNLGYKAESGKAVYNPVRDFINNLDELPFPDRDLYYKRYPDLAKLPTKRFFATRGCPYNCSFCYNHSYKKLYFGKGKYVRHRSAENVIKEILEVKGRLPTKTVRFSDDSFTLNKKWLYDFLERYKKEVNLPFTCLACANDLADGETAARLKEAKCVNLFFGIESGSEEIRNKILCKSLTDENIIKAAASLRKAKIPFGTYNMIGAPGETLDDCYKTILLNQKIKTRLPTSTILQPYPGTTLAVYAEERGYLDNVCNVDNFKGMISGSLLKLEHKNEMINLNSFFYFAIRFPFLLPLIKMLIKLPPNGSFKLLSFFSMGIVRLKAQNINAIDGLRLAIRFHKKM